MGGRNGLWGNGVKRLVAAWTGVAGAAAFSAAILSSPVLASGAISPEDAAAPLAIGPNSESPAADPTFRTLMVSVHNDLRARLGIPALEWDEGLASEASRYARTLATRDRMEHSAPIERRGQGENLAMGVLAYHDSAMLIDLWVDEESKLKSGVFPDVSRTGNYADVGHFTQMVWRQSRKVGCAERDNGKNTYLVCRYYPSGNVYGAEFRYPSEGIKTAINGY